MTTLGSGPLKLDMKHGFMQSIIKNQVDRDKYDKAVKAKQLTEKCKTPSSNNQHKKPERPTYVPPPRKVNNTCKNQGSQTIQKETFLMETESSSADNCDVLFSAPESCERSYPRPLPVPLFLLHYDDQFGKTHEIVVHKSDDPFVLARRFGNEQGLTPPMIKALSKRLREEMRKRTRCTEPDNKNT